MIELKSYAEQKAELATKLPSFPINLPEIKRAVANILSQFGRNLIFHEYTAHDVTHIDDMLETLDWLIPEETKSILSAGEWLMLVLAVYFHDMGLIVTEHEFNNRSDSEFHNFCHDKLFSGTAGADYKAKIALLEPTISERFLYQEFVRFNHARRVRLWIEGRPSLDLGFSESQIGEIDRLLSPLTPDFRRDLGLICESHNLDDLDDLKKYRLSYPYGNSDAETVNLQYCAIVLRTVDLLQITKRRTPSVLFHLISPTDPISQLEWAKQMAVKRVRPKLTLDEHGNALPFDTVEVFATFAEPEGFFGLTSYLRYARDQLSKSQDLIERSRKQTLRPYRFPWRIIDDANIEVVDYIKQPFGFEIDQEKVLDLLTGHTLYNDSNIVVRELAQNAIDAVRLQASIDQTLSEDVGVVKIVWNSTTSVLSILDNGTGMTQDVIEKHLLRVGSSRYQDPKFREQFPNFSPISRFGIGVLSSFMVADSVEIVTVSPAEDQARQVSLRSVHGKYLIKLLDKSHDSSAREIGPHGTLFRLKLRASARKLDVLATVRAWVRFPRCKVIVIVDDAVEEQVGYRSPRAALEAYLDTLTTERWRGPSKVRVEERELDGFTLAYALSYSSHFREWGFLLIPDRRSIDDGVNQLASATCIEGIAVEFGTPGFKARTILAIGNATGAGAPRTNVARSDIESTDEKEEIAAKVYKILFDAVVQEVQRLREKEAYSLTWAMLELPFLLGPLTNVASPYYKAFEIALSEVPMFLVEAEDHRKQESLHSLKNNSSFWTVESQLTRSVEQFIREARAEVTTREILKVSQGTTSALPDGLILTNVSESGIIRETLGKAFQVTCLSGNIADRRLDLKWSAGNNFWISLQNIFNSVARIGNRELAPLLQYFANRGARSARFNYSDILVPLEGVEIRGLSGYYACKAYNFLLLLPGNELTSFVSSKWTDAHDDGRSRAQLLVLLEAVSYIGNFQGGVACVDIDRIYKRMEGEVPSEFLASREEYQSVIKSMTGEWSVFDPLSWRQRGSEE